MITHILPHPELSKIVEYYWIEKNGRSNVKVLPDGTTSIIFNLGSPISISDSYDNHNELPDNLIIGTQKKYYVLNENKGTYLIGVKFTQGGAYHFFNLPMMKFSNRIINLKDVINGESENLRNKLRDAEVDEEIKEVLDNYLLLKVDSKNGTSDVVDFAIDKVQVNGSPQLIKNLCKDAKISNKHMITLFNKKVGLSPKILHRINKFIKVIEVIRNKPFVNWPEVAYDCHYYDQAHLINDFKHFSGFSPKKYHENENASGLRVMMV